MTNPFQKTETKAYSIPQDEVIEIEAEEVVEETPQAAAKETKQEAAKESKSVVTRQETIPDATDEMTHGEDYVSMEDDIKLGELDRLPSMDKDQTQRIAFLLFDGQGAPIFKQSTVISDQMAKKTLRVDHLKNDALVKHLAKTVDSAPKPRFATVVAFYDTNRDGEVISTSIELRALSFGSNKWPSYKKAHVTWKKSGGLQGHDIQQTCTNKEFQNVDLAVCPERYISEAPQLAELVEEAKELFRDKLDRYLGSKMSEQELSQEYGFDGPITGGQEAASGSNPFKGGGKQAQSASTKSGANPFAKAKADEEANTEFNDMVENPGKDSNAAK